MLGELERDLNTSIVDHLDLIVGTSTKGLISPHSRLLLSFSSTEGTSVTTKQRAVTRRKSWLEKNWIYIVGITGIISAIAAVIKL